MMLRFCNAKCRLACIGQLLWVFVYMYTIVVRTMLEWYNLIFNAMAHMSFSRFLQKKIQDLPLPRVIRFKTYNTISGKPAADACGQMTPKRSRKGSKHCKVDTKGSHCRYYHYQALALFVCLVAYRTTLPGAHQLECNTFQCCRSWGNWRFT